MTPRRLQRRDAADTSTVASRPDAFMPDAGGDTGAPDTEPLLSPARLPGLALVIALALVVARATIIELVRDPFQVSPGQAYTPIGTGPTVTLVLNLLSVVPALLILIWRVLTPGARLGTFASPVLLLALGLLATASAGWSTDRFSALVSGPTLAAAGLLCWAVAQSVTSWGRFRLVTATLAGLLLVYGAQGLFYRYVELSSLQTQVEASKDQLLAERGFEPGSFAAEQFLRRISAGEMIGFGASPNTYAAVMVMLGVVTAGLLVQGLARRRDPVLLVTLVAGIGIAIWCGSFTNSRTAVATPLLATGVVAVAFALRRVALRRRRSLFAGGVVLALLGVAAVVGHGLYHNSLPGDSLNFRWRYWVGSYHLFLEHPLLGVGYTNFGPHYLAHRLPAAAEEIRDPHNLLVRFATELGAVGLISSIAFLLSAGWEASRPSRAVEHEVPLPPRSDRLATPAVASLATVAVLGILINIFGSIDFAAPNNYYLVVELFKRLMFLGTLIVGSAFAFIASRTSTRADDAPAPWSLWAAGAALVAFLAHNLIDFSFFEPGPMFATALLLGAVVGLRRSLTPSVNLTESPGSSAGPPARFARPAAGFAAIVIVLASGVYLIRLAIPITAAERSALRGDELLRTAQDDRNPLRLHQVLQAATAYREAFSAVPYNADYALRTARALAISQANLPALRQYLDFAISAEPTSLRALLDRARLELSLPPDLADLPLAVTLLERATRLNPTDIPIRLDYARSLERTARPQDARAQYRLALTYNDLLDPKEPKRLPPTELESLRQKSSTP